MKILLTILTGMLILIFSLYAIADAKKNAIDEAKKSQKIVSLFPVNNFDGEGDLDELRQQATKSLVSGKIIESDIIYVSITSGWTDDVFPITLIPYRTIRGSVLFKDTDNDGLCRFNGYTFISVDKGNLEYKAVRGGGDGYAECDAGASVNGGIELGSRFFSTLLWFLLVIVNLVGGGLILKDKLAGIKAVQPIMDILQKNQTTIGLVAIGLGTVSFMMAFLSLSLLQSIIPQASAILIGVTLSAQFLISKRTDATGYITKIKPFTQPLGLAAVAVGAVHLVLSGGLYFI